MKLEQKAGLSVLVALTVMTGFVSVVLVQVVRRSFAEIEVQQAQIRVTGVNRSIEQELEGVARSTQDYAEWVDTSQYLLDRNQAYLDENYTAESLQNIRIDHVLIFARSGDFVKGRSARGTDGEAVADEARFVDVVRPIVDEIVAAGSKASPRRSVLRGPAGLLLVAVHPVIGVDEAAVFPGGVLAFVRELDAGVVARLTQLQGVPVQVHMDHEETYTRREASGSWLASGDGEGINAGDDHLIAHFALNDWQQRPVGWVHLELDRSVYAQGSRMSWLLVIVVAVTGIAFTALLVLLLRRLVTQRLQKTCDQLAVIEAAGRLEERLALEGNDELTRLGASINRMLDSLAQAQAERERREAEQRGLERQLLHAQKLEVVGTFAGGIAHDFNNHLAGVKGWLNLAQMAVKEGDLRQDYLEQAERAVQQGATLAKQLLLFSRREEVRLSEVQIGALVRESTEFIRVALPKSVVVNVAVRSDDTVRIDPAQLQQVLINLAVNASDAMDQAGIIAIEVRAQTLPAAEAPGSGKLSGPHVWLTIADHGPGVPPEVLPRIFEPFFTTKPSGKGTGLGLAVVHRIISSVGGTIEVQTSAGKGTTFHIYLPALGRVVQGTGERSALAGDSRPPSKGGVLIVDDDAMVCEVWAATLTMAGYTVTLANDGPQAWQLLQMRSLEFDVVVTDHVMPSMSGLELAKRIFVAFPALPVVMLTAVLPMSASELEASGFFAVLNKPVGRSALTAVVARAVARKSGSA